MRDADWVVIPSLIAAAMFASLAMVGGATTAAAVTHGLATAIGRAARADRSRSLGRRHPRCRRSRGRAPVRCCAAIVIGASLLAVFGMLFASADRAFAELADRAIPTVDDLGLVARPRLVVLRDRRVRGGARVAAASKPPKTEDEHPLGEDPRERGLGPVEWGIALGSLNALFAAFVAVQAAVLFGRDDHVLDTAGLTYAEYAREGFGQLARRHAAHARRRGGRGARVTGDHRRRSGSSSTGC